MSMYNLLFGANAAGPAILATLGLRPDDFRRYRDCFVADGKIAVYTRMGGNNRDMWYDPEFGGSEDGKEYEKLTGHPCFISDDDDDFDNTYSTFYFKFPDEFAEDLKKLDSGAPFDPDKRWLDAIEAINARK